MLLCPLQGTVFSGHKFIEGSPGDIVKGRRLGRPLVCPTSSAAELPFEGQSLGVADFAASERASEQDPVSRRRARATCHIGGDDNELLSQKGAPLPPPLRCRFLHVVYVSRAADDADVAAAPAPPTAARAAAAAGSATHAAARCNRPKKTGKKFRKTKTAARAKNRVAAQTAATVALLSEPRVGPAPPSVHAVIARAHGRCKAHGVQKHKRHACILGSKGGIGSKVQNQPHVIRTATEPIDSDWKIV